MCIRFLSFTPFQVEKVEAIGNQNLSSLDRRQASQSNLIMGITGQKLDLVHTLVASLSKPLI